MTTRQCVYAIIVAGLFQFALGERAPDIKACRLARDMVKRFQEHGDTLRLAEEFGARLESFEGNFAQFTMAMHIGIEALDKGDLTLAILYADTLAEMEDVIYERPKHGPADTALWLKTFKDIKNDPNHWVNHDCAALDRAM